jgi:protein-L-isoaspartate(D-aspartate) O-methyltransferase
MILKRHVNTWDSDRTADPDLVAYPTSTTPPTEAPGKIIAKPNIRLHLTYTA